MPTDYGLYFRDKFRSLFGENFQIWFEQLARVLHPAGDFQRIRKTSGDGGLDGFAISSQLVYQVYAPARINELKDGETSAKIRADFTAASNTLSGKLKTWVFVHNHPEAALGQLSVAAINNLRTQYPKTEISVLDINSLWERLKALPNETLRELCGGPASNQAQTSTIEEIVDLHKEISAGFTKTQDALQQLPTNLAAIVKGAMRSAMAESSQEAEHLKSQNQKRFDNARKELSEGSVVVAEREYRALVADLESLGELADKWLLFRSYTNLGSSLWQQFRQQEAVVWFDMAYTTKPDEQRAKSNKAVSLIYRREFPAALKILEELKATAPDCFDAYYLISCIHLEERNVNRAIAALEERRFDTDDYFEALAQVYLRGEDYPKAVESARAALAKNAKSTDAIVMLANGIGFPLVQRRSRRDTAALSLTDAELAQMREAITLGETAVAMFKAQGRSFQLGEMLTNLCAFYELAGEDENAAKAAKDAAELAPENVTALTNLWACQMKSGKYTSAYQTAGKLMKCGAKRPGKIRQLESLLMNAEHERLLRESENDPDFNSEFLSDSRFFELRARAQFEINQIEVAFDTIKAGLERFPQEPQLYCVRASILEDLGQLDSAQAELELAEKLASDDPPTLLQSAMFYLHRSNWAAAAQRFLKLGANSITSPFVESYLICLHNVGEYLQCIRLAAAAIAAKKDFSATLHELAARCAYHANDLRIAQRHLEILIQHGNAKLAQHLKMLAQVYLRLDEVDKALAVLKRAHARTSTDVEVLIGLSFVLTLKKQHKEAVRHAFAAVNSAGRNPRVHMAFVKAVVDCPADVKVEDKYQRAFQRSFEFLNKHSSGFIKTIPFEEDLRSIKALVKRRADHARHIENLVQERGLPMCILAGQLGVSPYLVWLALSGHRKLHVSMAYGTTEEQGKEVEAVLNANAVCLDIFALFTLRLLNQLGLLSKLGKTVLVHTAVFECIVETIRDLEQGKASMSINYHEGKLIHSEVHPDETGRRLLFLRDIRDFLKSGNAELVGLDAGFISTEDMKQAREFLGNTYYEPIMVSKSRAAAYYADDGPMRSLASHAHGVTCFCTQALLRVAKEKRLLTPAQYEEAIITLLRHNYYFVSETFETLHRLAELENFQPSELARMLLGRVADPNIDQNTAVHVMSDFCFSIWQADLSRSKGGREEWLDVCLDSILRAKQADRLLVLFVANLGVRALLYPAAFAGITRQWLRSDRLSASRRAIFHFCVQETIAQTAHVAKREFPWVKNLSADWSLMGRLNVMLQNNGWL